MKRRPFRALAVDPDDIVIPKSPGVVAEVAHQQIPRPARGTAKPLGMQRPIAGTDDAAILRDLWAEIEDVSLKYYAGLDDKTLEQWSYRRTHQPAQSDQAEYVRSRQF